ncbi:Brp/Blh family beta-carotene 15,15'-dioxygenase [Candidatus Pelagibacter communis]|jgi:Brp/Blh family beta-carotene 15,15'-monooxygenase|uniref:Probable beta-carotene 15,15'-dioxygenase n=1 Tax=Pelagibacter ubique (strain HTCC1062) TaxID=335992 RepID=Q4FPE2_PELUB|nr:Brp/Blh family beta-carotene 15,15'-dioxygenase [Candidatus Pelagibacter ubique]AAZ20947.1 possible transmembrane protein [Candidatus Pelagibacter ubique HTCC1062]MDA7487491.1 Brp/Blh family beta-carotene 15,15'-dioxygenase [Candidatus Pelagibacter ubique]MDA9076608.1 Brp/Blh family beta-carotene 15,15'-dioxygenase [bacterium]MDC1168956.1 Brp/Blh family beta-carotene 15,15'-dioxygenase [Candidatus Pelagibacter ubique]
MINNQIKKINFFHSIIFLFFSTSLALIFDQFKSLSISPIICLLLILSIGISHGALDNQKGKRLIKLYNINNIYYFYLIYLIIAATIIIIWLLAPTLSLIIFLVVAAYHFGKEDTEFLITKKSNIDIILYFLKGILIIIAPLMFHFVETINIFKLLLIQNESFYLFLNFIENNYIISFIFLISLLTNIYFFLKDFKLVNLLIFFDFTSILILNYFFTPLVAFTLYFCFLHSFRHSLSLITELDKYNFKNGLLIFIKKAAPLTILTAIFYLLSLYYLSNHYLVNEAIYKVIFIGLASLTFPHILLEYFLEKNEK